MRIDSRDKRNTASDCPQGLANGHLFTHCSVEEFKGEAFSMLKDVSAFYWYFSSVYVFIEIFCKHRSKLFTYRVKSKVQGTIRREYHTEPFLL